uniref:Integrase catalytic domain-containing protein n=1 Tax=Cyprinus carpio carpio TaxID=630221 RepID=A0A9J7ZY96_CYPCA
MFETVATWEAWPKEEWARIVAPLLTGEAQRAYFALPPEQSTCYEDLRKEILGRMGLSPISAAQLFNEWTFDPRQPARAQAASLSRLAQHWLLAGGPTVHQVAERVMVDRLLRALPRPLRQAAGMRNPKSARGHEHILVIMDYATRYPEAIPLRKATTKAIAQELFLLFSQVGIPSQILTDQGTLFMSRMMADVCKLLKVQQLSTMVYHPQTDGLVERFNQTLKQMLRRVAAEDKRDWDQMLPYVLFGVREIPQASTGFTPFELLFGQQPRGLLDVAREAWEQQPAVHRTTIEHVREMRERIDKVMPIIREHLVRAQQTQQPGRVPTPLRKRLAPLRTGYGSPVEGGRINSTTLTC